MTNDRSNYRTDLTLKQVADRIGEDRPRAHVEDGVLVLLSDRGRWVARLVLEKPEAAKTARSRRRKARTAASEGA